MSNLYLLLIIPAASIIAGGIWLIDWYSGLDEIEKELFNQPDGCEVIDISEYVANRNRR